jgi:hypothetical protein
MQGQIILNVTIIELHRDTNMIPNCYECFMKLCRPVFPALVEIAFKRIYTFIYLLFAERSHK